MSWCLPQVPSSVCKCYCSFNGCWDVVILNLMRQVHKLGGNVNCNSGLCQKVLTWQKYKHRRAQGMWKAPPPKEKKESLLALFLYTHQFYITPPKTKKQPDYVCFLFWFTFFLCSCFFRLNSSSTSCLFFWAIPKLFQLTKQTCIIIHPTIHLRDFWNDQFAQITWTLLHAGMFQSGF